LARGLAAADRQVLSEDDRLGLRASKAIWPCARNDSKFADRRDGITGTPDKFAQRGRNLPSANPLLHRGIGEMREAGHH
jgi:hypothetical protein